MLGLNENLHTVKNVPCDTDPSRSENYTRPTWIDEKEYPFSDRFVNIEGNNIHYIDEGQGPTIIFLHNVVMWSYEFRKMIKLLRDQFRCIALDYPGFGLSDPAEGFRNTIRANSNVVEIFIQKLGLEPAVLACSEGSVPIGVLIAEKYPNWISGLVMFGGFAWPMGGRALGSNRAANFFSKFVASDLARFLIIYFNFHVWYTMNFFPEKSKLSSNDKRAYSEPFKARASRRHQADLISVGRKDPVILAEIERRSKDITHVPVLIFAGEFDPTHKAGWDKRLACMFPNHNIEIVNDAHHFLTACSPEFFADKIGRWEERLLRH